ncbi:hypothetical protein [Heyndrickxia acidicola]|uniref:Uncharacterized protein n=1 Tax=Heyndrickxia acidicola TaxID=209389 RepID=A0ABU6MB81_9BACI|nr:hypothetical protein [Heyndrickxia acidicola]MED1201940.1 hypothetical protein [Heyndrickxia acidicola]
MLNDMLTMIVEALKKPNFSNLFTIINDQVQDLNDTLDTMEQWMDIDKAEGVVLDEIGSDVNQYRGQATDEIYRMMIRGKKARSSSDGTINSMIESLSKTLNCDPSQMQILSSIEAGEGEPAAIVIKKIPITTLNQVGMSANQFMQFVEQVVPGDARVSHVNLDGTFRFSSMLNEVETSPDGLSSDGSDGGTLSGVLVTATDIQLPI